MELIELCFGGLELWWELDVSIGGGDSVVDEGDELGEEKILLVVFVLY